MLRGVLDYIPTRKKARLIQQWVDKAGLPEEEVPPDLLKERAQKEDLTLHPIEQEKSFNSTIPISIDRGMVSLPLKYVLLGVSIITLQLVLLSIISTILAISSN